MCTMQSRRVGVWFLGVCVAGFTKQALAGEKQAAVQGICDDLASGKVAFRDGFEQLVMFRNASTQLAELGFGNLSNSRSTWSPMWDVVEQACGGEEEPEKVTLRSSVTSSNVQVYQDEEIAKAMKLAKEIVAETAHRVSDLKEKVSKARKDMGKFRIEIEKWSEMTMADFSMEVAHASSDLTLLDVELATLYHLLSNSLDIQSSTLSKTVGKSCRRFKGSLRQECQLRQLDGIEAIRTEVGLVMRAASKQLESFKQRTEVAIQKFVTIVQHTNRFTVRIEEHLQDKDGWFRDKIYDLMRKKCYVGCAAAVVLPPVLKMCYVACAWKIEHDIIPAMKQALEETKATVSKLSNSFSEIGTQADKLKTIEEERIKEMGELKGEIDKTMVAIHDCADGCLSWWKYTFPQEVDTLKVMIQNNLKNMES